MHLVINSFLRYRQQSFLWLTILYYMKIIGVFFARSHRSSRSMVNYFHHTWRYMYMISSAPLSFVDEIVELILLSWIACTPFLMNSSISIPRRLQITKLVQVLFLWFIFTSKPQKAFVIGIYNFQQFPKFSNSQISNIIFNPALLKKCCLKPARSVLLRPSIHLPTRGMLKILSHMTSPCASLRRWTQKIQAPQLHGDDLKVISVKLAEFHNSNNSGATGWVVNCEFFWGPGFFADILHKDLNLKNNKSQR